MNGDLSMMVRVSFAWWVWPVLDISGRICWVLYQLYPPLAEKWANAIAQVCIRGVRARPEIAR
jgi:hypothetical protein